MPDALAFLKSTFWGQSNSTEGKVFALHVLTRFDLPNPYHLQEVILENRAKSKP